MSKIEERITEVTQHGILFEFLGADNIERLKTEIVDAIVEQVKSDLRDSYDFIINPYELVEDIIDKAKQEVEEKLKKKFKNQCWNMQKNVLMNGAGKEVEKMNKCICDFCEEKEAVKSYRVYEDNLLSSLFDHYHSVDICKECYEKLFKKKGKADR